MNFLHFLCFLWVTFAHLDADLDRADHNKLEIIDALSLAFIKLPKGGL
jgi:hypothetical protein